MNRLVPAALALVAILAGTSTALAAGNQLTNPRVSPLNGSTTDTFTFSVDYSGGDAATSVRAVAGSLTVTLSLVPGGSANLGTWRTIRTLPAGTWTFTFEATTAGHPANPKAGSTVTVIVTGPTPTPPPTPRPTAPPPPTPTPTPARSPLASPVASASSGASSTATAPASVSPAPLGTASAGATSSSPAGGGLGGGGGVDQNLGRILTGGLVAIGLLAVVGFAAIWRDRRRREEEGLVLAPAQSTPLPTTEPRPTAEWERDFGLEDEPIGTIEYQPPGEEG